MLKNTLLKGTWMTYIYKGIQVILYISSIKSSTMNIFHTWNIKRRKEKTYKWNSNNKKQNTNIKKISTGPWKEIWSSFNQTDSIFNGLFPMYMT
jgi:hypothetical protein